MTPEQIRRAIAALLTMIRRAAREAEAAVAATEAREALDARWRNSGGGEEAREAWMVSEAGEATLARKTLAEAAFDGAMAD